MDVKSAALENARAAGLQVTLQVTVVNGWNADQVGPLVQFAIDRRLFGVLFQPIMFSGRDRAVSGPVTGIDAVTPGNRARRAHFPGCRASTSTTDGVV